MANEATLELQRSIPVPMTCANAAAITKGTWLALTTPKTVAAHAAKGEYVGGIAYTDKIANDGVTQIAVLRGPGDWVRATASGSIAAGDPVAFADSTSLNKLYSAKAAVQLSGSVIAGIALETVTTGQTFLVELNIQGASWALT